ncbi:hypothetical protein MASR2M15_28400 [Anaerolineales bacterium]
MRLKKFLLIGSCLGSLLLSVLTPALAQGYTPPTGPKDPNLLNVSQVEVSQSGDSVDIVVAGSVPSSCHHVSNVKQTLDGDTITLEVRVARTATMCSQVVKMIEESLSLDVAGLETGKTYQLVINGYETEFTYEGSGHSGGGDLIPSNCSKSIADTGIVELKFANVCFAFPMNAELKQSTQDVAIIYETLDYAQGVVPRLIVVVDSQDEALSLSERVLGGEVDMSEWQSSQTLLGYPVLTHLNTDSMIPELNAMITIEDQRIFVRMLPADARFGEAYESAKAYFDLLMSTIQVAHD